MWCPRISTYTGQKTTECGSGVEAGGVELDLALLSLVELLLRLGTQLLLGVIDDGEGGAVELGTRLTGCRLAWRRR